MKWGVVYIMATFAVEEDDLFGSSSDSDTDGESDGGNGGDLKGVETLAAAMATAILSNCKSVSIVEDLVGKRRTITPRVLYLDVVHERPGAAPALYERLVARLAKTVSLGYSGVSLGGEVFRSPGRTGTVFDGVILSAIHMPGVAACSVDTLVKSVRRLLVGGGSTFFVENASNNGGANVFSGASLSPIVKAQNGGWQAETLFSVPSPKSASITVIRRRSTVQTNTLSSDGRAFDHEAEAVEKCVVSRPVGEIEAGCLSLQSHRRAVDNLREYGICIIPSYFSSGTVVDGGQAAVRDMEDGVARLEREKGLSLFPHPPVDADFEGYAAVDAQFVRGHGDKFTLRRGEHVSNFSKEHGEALRHDPSLIAVLEEACLPGEMKMGKEWIEERKSQTMLRRSSSLLESQELGAVVSLPGNGPVEDQVLHVDSEHLYEHVHLPPHYLVMFLPALATDRELDFQVGQTAFLVGSHKNEAARGLAAGGRQPAHARRFLNDRCIRPHVKAGDAILFDARIMHFGLANSSPSVKRAALFVNYARPWFCDMQPGGEIIVRHR